MELRQLRYFVAVAEELNFGRAAERMYVVQPAVSQQVRRLELELGVELFHRSTRRVTLTPAGRRLLPRARAVLDAERRARQSVRRPDAPSGTLTVGTSTGLGDRLRRVLDAMARLHPDTEVLLVRVPADERLRAVADGSLDAAVVRGDVGYPGLRVIPVWRDELLVALPRAHPLAAGGPVPLEALAGIPLRMVAPARNPPLATVVAEACRDAGFEPTVGPSSSSDQDTLAALSTGRPSWTVYYASHAAQLNAEALGVAFLPVRGGPLTMPTSLVVRPGDGAPALAALVRACLDSAGS